MKNVVTHALLSGIDTSINAAFNKGQARSPNFVKFLGLMVVNSTNASETYGWLADIPELEKNPAELKLTAVKLDGHKIENDEFKGGVKIPRQAIEDDAYGMFAPIAEQLGMNGNAVPDYDLITFLNASFTTGLSWTGKALFATDHPIGNGVVHSNKMLKKLSAANFEEGYAAIRGAKKGTGKPLFTLLDPKKVFLIVGENYESTANGIVGVEKLAGGADNPNYGKATVVVIPTLGHQWFIFDCSGVITPVIFQDRIPLQLTAAFGETDENVLMRDEYVWKARRRCALGAGEPRRCYGSTGANAA